MPPLLLHEPCLVAASPGAPAPVWIPLLAPVLFPFLLVGMWLLVCTVLAWMAGHRALLQLYPPVEEPLPESFGWASGTMRWVNFNNSLFVGLGEQGLHLAPNGFIRPPFMRGIPCIPWDDLRCVQVQEEGLLSWLKGGSRFEVVPLSLAFRVNGAPGRALARRLGHP